MGLWTRNSQLLQHRLHLVMREQDSTETAVSVFCLLLRQDELAQWVFCKLGV